MLVIRAAGWAAGREPGNHNPDWGYGFRARRCAASRRTAIHLLPLEQPRHQPPRQHAGNASAIVAGRERGLHRHDLIADERVEALEARARRADHRTSASVPSSSTGRGLVPVNATRSSTRRSPSRAQRHGNPGHGILNGTANADLFVGRAQPRRVSCPHRGDELALAQRR